MNRVTRSMYWTYKIQFTIHRFPVNMRIHNTSLKRIKTYVQNISPKMNKTESKSIFFNNSLIFLWHNPLFLCYDLFYLFKERSFLNSRLSSLIFYLLLILCTYIITTISLLMCSYFFSWDWYEQFLLGKPYLWIRFELSFLLSRSILPPPYTLSVLLSSYHKLPHFHVFEISVTFWTSIILVFYNLSLFTVVFTQSMV